MNIWFKWNCEVITADHDGYCSGEDNVETVSHDIYYCRYDVSNDEYYTLIWINNNCFQMFNLSWFIGATKPYIENEEIDTPFRSGYCYESTNGLKHEILTTPIEILEFAIKKSDVKDLINTSSGLTSFLKPILDKNDVINECFENILPMESIDIILVYMWCIYVNDNII